ncbi:hypothetical protein KUCAC02_002297 [Chaenocephalus aceratus]|uniref:Uncharacterized protein n=1 Tax=Chaenocephalus aceratus TaxID=36190 RepID=A0ACB9XT58_CHAAC|nr:hypothetical protein KUCAC02_002297 [Chaenocephalus aceratus]
MEATKLGIGPCHLAREVLILGASNISRLPLVHDPRVQVDSFPGANLTQAATIIRKNTVTSPGLQKVVLLFGLSDWNIRDSTLLNSLGQFQLYPLYSSPVSVALAFPVVLLLAYAQVSPCFCVLLSQHGTTKETLVAVV